MASLSKILYITSGFVLLAAVSGYFGADLPAIPYIEKISFSQVKASTLLISALSLFLVSFASSLISQYILDLLCTKIEMDLKSDFFISCCSKDFPNQYYISDFHTKKLIISIINKFRPLVKVYRTQVAVLPGLVQLVLYILILSYLSAWVVLPVFLLASLLYIKNVFILKLVKLKESNYIVVSKDVVERLNSKLSLTEDIGNIKLLFEKQVSAYYFRGFIPTISNALTLLFSFLYVFLVFFVYVTYFEVQVEIELILMIIFLVQGIIGVIAQLSASSSVFHKYLFHAVLALEYLFKPNKTQFVPLRREGGLVHSKRITVVGIAPLSNLNVQFYLSKIAVLSPLLYSRAKSVFYDLEDGVIQLEYQSGLSTKYFSFKIVQEFEGQQIKRIFLIDEIFSLGHDGKEDFASIRQKLKDEVRLAKANISKTNTNADREFEF